MTLPTCRQLYNGNAGFCWNLICCPIVGTVGLFWRSIKIYLVPCNTILCQRFVVGCLWKYFCRCYSWPYEDKTFFGEMAIGDFDDKSAKEYEKETDWVRAEHLQAFKGKRPQLFEGKIEPGDLCQGAVGDCWLVAAFACASEFPHVIRHQFLTKEYNPRGLYKIRIFDPQLEKWVIVKVDDRIPCKKGTKKPHFMKPNGNELWAMILEKAYAKHCGSYAKMEGGFVLWGWLSMTGNHVFQMSLDEKGGGKRWLREDMVAIKNIEDKRACAFRSTKEKFSEDQVWTLLTKYDRQKALISASIGKSVYRGNDGPRGEQMLDDKGLVAGHAYSVIAAKEVAQRGPGGLPKAGAKTYRLLQLRNPWGSFEWKGKWSDNSSMWKKYPSIAKQLNFEPADDGTFWMEFQDFKKTFTRINICDRDTRTDASLDVNEDSGSCGVFSGFLCGCSKFWCLCHGIRNLYFGHETTDETLDLKERVCFIC
ncbi:calcium-dependent cytoplasmic cysteine proteinase, papain-like protein [Nitzschia inconspicua]|uniref:Calcium-dependent cytoplasmic cysteine proteinase, papain-like protein n=1 Tax=Nitzschia inconspicua TaxID=303405 RepID=A0A9K3LND0_9STRA|nr:calcium-dependent cytoplasmic cysteine proteinase, papain-like protein [Nitzschia inconspicua]